MKQLTLLIAICSYFISFQPLLGQLSLLNNQDGHLEMTFDDFDGAVYSVAWNLNGKNIAAGEENGTLKVWGMKEEELVFEVKGHFRPIRHIQYLSVTEAILTAGDRSVKIWNEGDADPVRIFTGHQTDILSVGLSENEQKMVTGSYEKQVKLWKVNVEKSMIELEGHEKSVVAADISPDGKYIASGDMVNVVKIWNAETLEEIHSLEAHGDVIMDIQFTPDGKYFASASADNTIKIWETQTGEIKKVYTGHQLGITSIDFSKDGKYLISGSSDLTINLYEIYSGEKLYTFVGHEDIINDVAWNPKMMKFASCSADGSVKIWNVSKDIFVNHYFEPDIVEEMDESELFDEKQRGESRDEYKLRVEKAEKFEKQLMEKYYQKYLKMIEGRSF